MKRKRKKKTGQGEKKVIDNILRATFMGRKVFIVAPLFGDTSKKKNILMMIGGVVIVRFNVLVTKDMSLRFREPISPREAMEFFQTHKACALYPKIG